MGANTKLAERRLTLIYDNGKVSQGVIDETWLCGDCGGTFLPAASRVEKWNLPFAKKRKGRSAGIPKKWIIEELFHG